MSLVPRAICEQGLPAVLKYIWPNREPEILEKIAAEWDRDEQFQMLAWLDRRYKQCTSS